jgi:hypothetical protein
MTRGRTLIVVGQVVASALALALVYLTLLNPGDDSPLFGVEAPNDAFPTNPPQAGKPAADKEGGRQGDAGGGQGGAAPGGGAGGPIFEPGSSLAPDDSPLEVERNGPTVTQYRNTLTEIRQRLEAG